MRDDMKGKGDLLLREDPQEAEKEFLFADAKTDVGFKHMLSDLESRKSFFEAMTGYQLGEVRDYTTSLPFEKETPEQTQRPMDCALQAEDGTIFTAEMQRAKHNGWLKRSFFHPCGTYFLQLQRGDFWGNLQKVVTVNIVDFDSGLIQQPDAYESWYQFREETDPSLIFPYIRVGQLELPRINLEDPILQMSLRLEWFRIVKESKTMTGIPDHFSRGAQIALTSLIKRGWTMIDQELHNAQLRDLSNYSEAFAEERQEGFQQGILQGVTRGKAEGKAEGFIEGMKAMARKMLMLHRPLHEIITDTGLSENEILELSHA